MISAIIRRHNSEDEYFTAEGCHITELSNFADDPGLSIARARVEPGRTTRWHRLHDTVERYVIVSGKGRVEVGDLPPTTVGVGDVVLIPAMCRQRISNIGVTDLVFLAICTPRFSDRVYQDLDQNFNEYFPTESKMLEKNQSAPEFTAVDQDGNEIKMSDFAGTHNVVLYFYPKDDTPGCTVEAQQFTALANEFAELDTVIIGVSKDSCESHRAFIEKYALNVKLLADTTGEVCERYGVWQEKEKNGQKKMGIVRSTFVVDKHGVLADAVYNVSADGHAEAILAKIRQL